MERDGAPNNVLFWHDFWNIWRIIGRKRGDLHSVSVQKCVCLCLCMCMTGKIGTRMTDPEVTRITRGATGLCPGQTQVHAQVQRETETDRGAPGGCLGGPAMVLSPSGPVVLWFYGCYRKWGGGESQRLGVINCPFVMPTTHKYHHLLPSALTRRPPGLPVN